MSYRVTNSMMQSLMLNDMHANLSKLVDLQQQLSTQRKYQHASENPHAVTKGMGLETMMTETDQYIKNLEDAISWLKFTDDSLGKMNDLFARIRELAEKGGDGSLESVDRMAVGAELRQLKEALMSLANTTIGSEYLFSGLKTNTIPFTIGTDGKVVFNGNNYALNWEFARQQTGRVSLTGREVFPLDETTNKLKGIEVPMDFQWTGRNEILEFKVGWRTVKVRIPERWKDEIANGLTDPSDYNRFRDPGEPLEGWSLDEIANLINNSVEMGDASKLIKATVVKDLERGVQYLQIQSLTGEPVRLTGWPETDPVKSGEGIKGAAYGPAGRTASADGKIDIRFGDDQIYSVSVKKGDSLENIAKSLNSLPDGRIWAAYKSDGTNEWIDIAGRNPGDYYSIATTGGATQIFATETATVTSGKIGNDSVVTSNAFDSTASFTSLSDGALTIRQGYNTYTLNVPAGTALSGIPALILSFTPPLPSGMTVAVNAAGALEIKDTSGEAFSVTADGGMVPLLSDGVHGASNAQANSSGKFTLDTRPLPMNFELDAVTYKSALSYEYGGKKYWLDLSSLGTSASLDDVRTELEASIKTNIDSGAAVTMMKGLDDDGSEVQWMRVESPKGPIVLSGFGGAADALGSFVVGSEPIAENLDHTHIGFAAMMQMETTLTSKEIPLPQTTWDTTVARQAVHLNFVSGNNRNEVFIADSAALTIDELAARINSVCGSWLQAIVETDAPDGVNPINDPLRNSGDNAEGATKRLVLRTIDGEPFTVYDGLGKVGAEAGSYASDLGFNTSLTVSNIPLWDTATNSPLAGGAGYPSDGAGFFDENMPAILKVTVGDREFEVKVCKNNCYDGKTVSEAIVRQVNEQYGGALLSLGENKNPNPPASDTYSIFALSGEPLRVVDAPYGDPRFSEFTGGIATQLGINAGITAAPRLTPMLDTTPVTASNGVIRISTPGHTVDVPVLAGETMQTVANRIRDYAGGWLDVSFSDSNIAAAGGFVRLAIAAKDGSAVSVYDAKGDAAWNMGLDTGLAGSADLSAFDFTKLSNDATLTINVNGASHTIDLWDGDAMPLGTGAPTVNNVEELAAMINTRFQGQDIRAEIIGDGGVKYLAIWSPKGYNFSVTGAGTDTVSGSNIPDAFGFAAGINQASNAHGLANQPFNQVVTRRTGDNAYATDFFGVMDNLINTVEGGDVDGLSDTMLSQLDRWLSTLLKSRATDGALTNRYEAAVYRMTSNNTNYTDLYTQTVGVDLAEAITEYEMAQSIYQSSLAVMARLIMPSLLDFLK